jgi:multiple sugar transport system substrate-binding protein
MDLELSTRGSTYDVINVTFIYQNRWIGAGWVSDLDEFTTDVNATPSDWDAGDFVPGVQASMRDAKGHTYAYGIEAGAMILGAARGDLIEKAGLKLPTNFDEVIKVCLDGRQTAPLELDPLPDGDGRERLQRSAAELDPDA